MVPAIATNVRKPEIRPTLNFLFSNIVKSTMGCSIFCSISRNNTKKTIEMRNSTRTNRSVKPCSCPTVRAKSREIKLMNSVIAPKKSNLPLHLGREAGTNLKTMRIPRIPTGKLTKKIQRHEKVSIKRPPRTGPITMPVETIEPLIPKAFPRSDPGNASVMMAVPNATIIAAPNPWITRDPMSQ